jgi:hypothetical protein
MNLVELLTALSHGMVKVGCRLASKRSAKISKNGSRVTICFASRRPPVLAGAGMQPAYQIFLVLLRKGGYGLLLPRVLYASCG